MASSSPIAKQISECFIKPKTTQKSVHLTPWDCLVLSHPYIQKGFLFKPKPNPAANFLHKLKESLSIALVQFYSLASQLETRFNEDDRTFSIFIDCNKGPGARFVHATLNVTVSEISSPATRQQSVIDSLFDHNGAVNHDGHVRPLLAVQVTELTDGIFISCCMNHVCADGESYWNFLNSWSEIFMNASISRPPVYERWFIDGRWPLNLPHDFRPQRRSENSEFEERVFHFSAESIAKLKAKANSESTGININRISSFQALAALVWRCITRARSVPDETYTDCVLTFNNRGRLNPPLSPNYFGNCVQIGAASATAGQLLQRSLGWVAMQVNEVVRSHNDERVRARIEKWMKNPGAGVYRSGVSNYSVVFGGSTRFDCYGAEFGMGKAEAVINGRGSKREGKVICGAGRDELGSVDLEVCLVQNSMSALQLDAEFLEFLFN